MSVVAVLLMVVAVVEEAVMAAMVEVGMMVAFLFMISIEQDRYNRY